MVRADNLVSVKLLVNDLERSADFYKSVCGFTEWHRVEAKIAGRDISEIIFQPVQPGSASFVLLHFHDRRSPSGSEVINVIQTEDMGSFVPRALAAGATMVQAMSDMPEHGVKVAFLNDPEGHLLEIIELLPS